ncbi:MAG: 5-(carboxyamino)imidazole ribonucleotide synthase [Pseudomonadota bacterium]|jgi:5-(carboxyamino)imidazole ribonucleotide synthase
MILPPATLGMLGGGQLGRFFVIAAHELGYRVTVLDPDPHSPAGALAERHLVAPYHDPDALNELARTCAAVTTEFENVPADTLDYLSKFVPVHPSAACVAVAQNRVREKSFFRDHRLPVGSFAVIHGVEDVEAAGPELFPGVLKVARFGYDGKGQARVKDAAEAKLAFLGFKGEPCVLERLLPLDCEVSVVLARAADGAALCFPVAENRHTRGILDVSIVPARVSDALRAEAETLALRVASTLGYVGVLGVEMFVSEGRLLLNEIAPRPHNSGHYTIDACVTNQFEQQVRVLCGLPLGEPRAHCAAVMVNLLGDLWRDGKPPHWPELLAEPNLKLHLYGKHHARPGRKMGHFTVIDSDAERCLKVALAARAAIGIA